VQKRQKEMVWEESSVSSSVRSTKGGGDVATRGMKLTGLRDRDLLAGVSLPGGGSVSSVHSVSLALLVMVVNVSVSNSKSVESHSFCPCGQPVRLF
jgi:hypothetical protein